MKKLFFYAVAAAGLLSACSSNDDVIATGGENPDGPQAIKIGVSSVATQVNTRGTGTVGGVFDGDTEVTTNKWAGQKVNVYMFETGTLTKAMDGTGVALYDNAEMTTPLDAATGEASLAENMYRYYPATGVFDFWGYRLDGAEGENTVTEGETAYTVDFTIDGSQDVMRAKAGYELAEDETWKGTVTEDDIYSAKAARQGYQPELVFNHLLTRFSFQIKGGTEGACPVETTVEGETTLDETTAVKVEKIELTSKTNGTLTIAHTGEAPENYITWTGGEESADTDTEADTYPSDGVLVDGTTFLPYLTLKDRATKNVDETVVPDESAELIDFAGATPNVWADGASEPKTIGEALLVSPDMEEYTLRVTLSQKVLKHALADGATASEEDYETKTNVYTLPIKASDVTKNSASAGLTSFLAGTSYNVIITVYGFERIVVNTTLTPWVDGGQVEVGQD